MDLGLEAVEATFLGQNFERNRLVGILEAKYLWFRWEEAKTTAVLHSSSTKK